MSCTCLKDTEERLKTRLLDSDMNPPGELESTRAKDTALLLSTGKWALSIPYVCDWKITTKKGAVKSKRTEINMIASHCPFCGKEFA